MNITNQLGQLTELWCQLDFCERGVVLSQPTNPSSRYDFIAEINNKLYRIQCKTAHEETNDRIKIHIISKNWSSKEKHNYLGQIDYFYTHWKNKGYLIPISLCTATNKEKFLRLGEPSQYHSNNIKAIYGKDYELDIILEKLSPGISEKRITIEMSEKRKEAHKRVKENNEQINKDVDDKESNRCIDCGRLIEKNTTRCIECYKKYKHPSDIPTRDELKELIRTLPFTKIGEKFGRTDNAIRKWCDMYSLPRKKADIKAINDSDWINI